MFKCKVCNDSGWEKIDKDGKEFLRKCRCQGFNPFLNKCQTANIPDLFIGARLDDFQLKKNTEHLSPIIKQMKKFVNQYPAVQEGIILHGVVGIGKTRILSSIASEIIKKQPMLNVFYIDWNDIFKDLDIRDSNNFRDYPVINELLNKMKHASLLIIDELGSIEFNQWIHNNIYYVLNYRYNRKKITLFATNYFDETDGERPTLKKRIGDRIRSRIYEMAKSYYMDGLDYRKYAANPDREDFNE